MKAIRFVLPQLLFGFIGAFIGVTNALVKAWEHRGGVWDAVLEGRASALPAARIGPEILVIILGVVFVIVLAALFMFTLNGLVAGFVGWLGGVVFGGLYDVVRLRGPLQKDFFVVKRFAGYGSVLAVLLTILASFSMGLRDTAGVFCVSGFFLWMFGAIVGFVVYFVRR